MTEFGWDQDEVTQPASKFFIIGAFMTPLIAILFDRYSTKFIMMFGIVVAIVGLIIYPNITSLEQLTIVYLIFALGLSGSGLVPNMLILTRWFKRYRGIAIGILLMGSSLGGAVFPLMVKESLITKGWREAIITITIVGTVMMAGAIIFLVKNYPSDKGLNPDGDSDEQVSASGETQAGQHVGHTLRSALKTQVFYLLAIATAALWFCIVGILNHQPIFLRQDVGISVETFPVMLSLFFWSAIVGKLLFGYLCDKYNRIFIMFLSVINLIVGLLLLRIANIEQTYMLYAYAIILGGGFSGAFCNDTSCHC